MHDDLPCMDDDDVRRGRPTVHKVYGSRTAILGGIAMIPLAVRVVRDSVQAMRLPQQARAKLLETLLDAGGARGMIGGQLRDLAGEGSSLSLEEREGIHSAKTGALIVASVRMGGLAAGAGEAQIAALERYGRAVGLAFQIMDDVLDVTSTTSALGKTTGRDAALGKSTYPALLGIEGARQRAQALIGDGLKSLGEQKMLTIGRALMTNPDLLILDEATEGLAPVIAREIWHIVKAIRATGIATIIVDKNFAAISAITDRNIILVKGRVVFDGTSSVLGQQPELLQRCLGI
jgi:geranylgeranyl pyrophosphate synthase